MQAPTSRPPFDPPEMASFGVDVYPFAISHSAAAMKSSKTFCFLELGPGLVPLLAVLAAAAEVGQAYRPPISIQASTDGLNAGVSEALNPP